MSAMVSVSQQRVKLAKEVLEDFKNSRFPNNCKTMDGLTVVPNQEAMAISVTAVYEWRCGRTAVIPCLNGFTAEVREINPAGYGSWVCYLALVHKDFPINSNS